MRKALIIIVAFLFTGLLSIPAGAMTKSLSSKIDSKKYENTYYRFSFKFPSSMEAGDDIDYAKGSVPTPSKGSYFQTKGYPGKGDAYKKAMWSHITVQKNETASLPAIAKKFYGGQNVTMKLVNTKIGTTPSLAVLLTLKDNFVKGSEGPYPFKTYFVKKGTTLYIIEGNSNFYPATKNFVKDFDGVVKSLTVSE